MLQTGDKIQFEYRSEIEKVQEILIKYTKAYPEDEDNPVLKELYDKLDVMHMGW